MSYARYKQLEKQRGKPLSRILIEEFDQHGSQIAVAESLGVSQSTVSTWLMRLNLKQHIVLRPNNHQEQQAS